MIGIGVGITGQQLGDVIGQIITLAEGGVTPATSALTVGQALDDTTNWATFLNAANYASIEGTIVSAVADFTGASVGDATTAFADLDTNRFAIVVTDSEGNVRTFNAGSRTVRHIAPVAGTLAPVNEAQGSGTPTVALAAGFTGQALEYTSNQAWATVSGSTLTIADEVRTGTVQITATNSGGAAFVDLSVTIAAPVVAVISPIADQSFVQNSGDVTIDLDTVFTNATSYSVTGAGASVSGSTLTLNDNTLRTGVTITVTGSNAFNSAQDTFTLTVTEAPAPDPTPAATFTANPDGTATLASLTPATAPLFEAMPNGTARRIL